VGITGEYGNIHCCISFDIKLIIFSELEIVYQSGSWAYEKPIFDILTIKPSMSSAGLPILVNDKKTIRAWAIFDWANSAYALVITAAIFPGYFLAITDDKINVLGTELTNATLYSFAISGAYLIIALFSPLLSGIADYGGRRKSFLKVFTTVGALACIALVFFKDMTDIELGVGAFMIATIGFAGGLVFYNSYLPLITTEDRYDSVSAKGFAYGYVGSVILLIMNLVVIENYGWFDLNDKGAAARVAFVMVGLWWLGFAQYTFRNLPDDVKIGKKSDLVKRGYQELKSVWQVAKTQVNLKRFLAAFFFYSAGAQTVIFMAAIFAEQELGFSTTNMIILILILQAVGIVGAFLFAKLSEMKGNKISILTILILWTGICLAAYSVTESVEFYIVAAFVGLVMGGIQSMSRSTYSKLLPEGEDDTTSYFSFFDVVEKVSIIVGTFSFGLIEYLTGGLRNSVLALAGFFIIGILLMISVKIVAAQITVNSK